MDRSTVDNCSAQHDVRVGLLYGVCAYLWWGFFPLYLKFITHVPAMLIAAHRVVWSLVFLLVLVALQRRFADVRSVAASRRNLLLLVTAAVLIAANWLAFIYSVETGRVIQASLGYYINPLLSVVLGMVVLRERLRPWQIAATLLAAVGVANMAIRGDAFPWIALTVAFSFAFYSLVRKFVIVHPIVGLTIETAVLAPLAVAFIGWRTAAVGHAFSPFTLALLVTSGIVTAVPLLAFAASASRLRLSTIGFLQYIAPTCQLLVAVLVFGEPLRPATAASFGLIWLGLAVYTIDSLRARRVMPAVEMAE